MIKRKKAASKDEQAIKSDGRRRKVAQNIVISFTRCLPREMLMGGCDLEDVRMRVSLRI